MRDAFIDVLLEVPLKEIQALDDPTAELYTAMLAAADAKCAEAGATLRTDRHPEVVVQEAHSSLLGDFTLVASRWAVVVPEGVL